MFDCGDICGVLYSLWKWSLRLYDKDSCRFYFFRHVLGGKMWSKSNNFTESRFLIIFVAYDHEFSNSLEGDFWHICASVSLYQNKFLAVYKNLCKCNVSLPDAWNLHFYVRKNGIHAKLDRWYYTINIRSAIFVSYCRSKCEDFHSAGGETNAFIGSF